MDSRAHWESIYSTKNPAQVSWFEAEPIRSFGWVAAYLQDKTQGVVDIGAGASLLSQRLVEAGYSNVSALDLSHAALQVASMRYLASEAGTKSPECIQWLVSDLLSWKPTQQYAVWHDRAVLHFLDNAMDQAAYVARLTAALKPGGHAIISVFATDGPTHCSGIQVQQYDPLMLDNLLGKSFNRIEAIKWQHRTPNGTEQNFQTVIYQRTN